MVHFVGAGCGAPDLITLRGRRLLEEADVIIYAGSLVNPALLGFAKKDCRIYNSAQMTLEEVIAVMEEAESRQQMTVRLHTGDPSLYGAIREQIDCLKEQEISYDVTPGVSSFCGAAAALDAEYTRDHYPDGGADAGAGSRVDRFPCGARLRDGHFPERRDAGGTAARAVKGRLHGADTGSDCIQGKLAGRAHAALSARKSCPVRERSRHFPNGACNGRKFPRGCL